MKKIGGGRRLGTLVAALALTVSVAGCGPRAGRDGAGPDHRGPDTPSTSSTTATDGLDDLDDLLSDIDDALAEADATPADSD